MVSTKAKKEQLQRKRAQKRDKRDKEDSDVDWGAEEELSLSEGGKETKTPVDTKAAEQLQQQQRLMNKKALTADQQLVHMEKMKQTQQLVHMEKMKQTQVRAHPSSKPVANTHMELLPVGADQIPPGIKLGMPKRPNWRGIIRSADELHRLEKKSFEDWSKMLQAHPAGMDRISFFEPRLEYWRQLWRVLDLNPLLHFSDALTRHIIEEHRHQAVLVMNKCDLVPPHCVEQWSNYFQHRYPGLRVVPISANSGEGDATSSGLAIVEAIRECQVSRAKQRLKGPVAPGTTPTTDTGAPTPHHNGNGGPSGTEGAPRRGVPRAQGTLPQPPLHRSPPYPTHQLQPLTPKLSS
eukprot:gene28311-31422_t